VPRLFSCWYKLQELSATLYFVMGAMAKMVATFVTYPIQLVQSRLRVTTQSNSASLHQNRSMLT